MVVYFINIGAHGGSTVTVWMGKKKSGCRCSHCLHALAMRALSLSVHTILRTCKIYPLSGFRSCSNRKYTVIVVHIITLKITLNEERFLASPASMVFALSLSLSLCLHVPLPISFAFRSLYSHFSIFCFLSLNSLLCVLLKMFMLFCSFFPVVSFASSFAFGSSL